MPRPSRLAEPVTLPGKAGKALEALGIETVGDLIEHLPREHVEREGRKIADLRQGERAAVAAVVRSVSVRPMRNRRQKRVEARVADDTGPMLATWFNRPWVAKPLVEGTAVLLYGTRKDRNQFWVDEFEVLNGGGLAGAPGTGRVPLYPATAGIDAQQLRKLIWEHRGAFRHVVEPLPAALRAAERLADRPAALAGVHFPDDEDEETGARRRLAFEELLLLQLALAGRRRARREGRRAAGLEPRDELSGPWRESLPFTLTGDQQAAVAAIDADLASERPMQRLLMGEVGSGKAQPLDALVLTPAGFRQMGQLAVGGEVVGPTGERTRIKGVFPQGTRDTWRVHFSDGTSAECDADHLWQVRTSAARHRGDRPKVKPLREIARDLLGANGYPKWHVELPSPAEFDCGESRPMDAYLLGLLLGDGGFSVRDRVRFTSADPELVAAVELALPSGCELRKEPHRAYDWKIVNARRPKPTQALGRVVDDSPGPLEAAYLAGASCEAIAVHAGVCGGTVRRRLLSARVPLRRGHRSPSPLAAALHQLGLMGKRSAEKAVPSAYLAAPIKDRHALLQGLMDTDGTLNRHGISVSFSSTSRQLAEDVAWLVRSLGGRATCRRVQRRSGVSWRTGIALPARFPPFRLQRKASRLRPRTKYAKPAKAIESLEYVGRKAVQCIAVEHPSQLYVTDDFTVTHNTVVAIHAMLRAVENGSQAAFMAPTETLAEQHHSTLDRLLGGLVPVELLTGSTPAARRRDLLARLASGELGMVVGTHALIEGTVEFRDLALCVVDEQHRFGVRQRAALDGKAPRSPSGSRLVPHTLHMTATPIPRTLSLTAYGDLDTTVLRELPSGRRPVETHVVDGAPARRRAYERIREEIAKGRQCFVVCPLVEESEALQAKAATAEFEHLRETEFRGQRVELIHGQMPHAKKQAAMEAFAAGEADVLVATSVIEVGIDVPNASVMLIEAAERYGLSQLHQLRGRVGRGEHQSLCIVFGDPALPRLEAIAGSGDGFELAEIDLKIRGAGEVLGTRQHGIQEFRVARLPDDAELAERARMWADRLADEDDPLLRAAASERFGSDLDPIPA